MKENGKTCRHDAKFTKWLGYRSLILKPAQLILYHVLNSGFNVFLGFYGFAASSRRLIIHTYPRYITAPISADNPSHSIQLLAETSLKTQGPRR